MLQPKKTKYRKAHKGRIKGVATSATTLNYGTYGLKALEEQEECGLEYFLMFQFQKNLQK